MVLFLVLLGACWGPLALLVHRIGRSLGRPHTATAVALVVLYGLFVWLVRIWGRQVHGWPCPRRQLGLVGPWQTFGLRLVLSSILGLTGVLLLFGVELALGWATPSMPTMGPLRLVTEAALVGGAYGFCEELLFRGWLLAELEVGSRPRLALLANAAVFALAHFIKPLSEVIRTLPQFVGLFVLGLALVWARRAVIDRGHKPRGVSPSPASLALPIGLHGGLVGSYYLFNVGNLVTYTGRVPEWVTGVDQNPLAGLLGVGLLSAIALIFARHAQLTTHPTTPSPTTPSQRPR
ncbi:MAG: type II CAAX endopeptidase family protein [Cyanobacteria bacterium J06626_23]